MRHEHVTSVLGPVDEALIADIIRTGATREELAAAWAWKNAEEALIDEGHSPPSGRVAELLTLLESAEPEEEF